MQSSTSVSSLGDLSSNRILKNDWKTSIVICDCHGVGKHFYSALNFEGTKIVTTGFNNTDIKLWNVFTGQELSSYRMPDEFFMISGFISEDRVVVVTKDYIGILNSQFEDIEKIIHFNFLTALLNEGIDYNTMSDFNATPFGSKAFSSHNNGIIKIWDLKGRKLLTKFEDYLISSPSDMDNKGNYLLSGCSDGCVKLWRLKRKLIKREFYGHRDSVTAVQLKVNLKKIVSGSLDHTVIVWDIKSTGILFRLKGHTDIVLSVHWSFDNSLVLSTSQDKTVIVWDTENGAIIQVLEGHNAEVISVSSSSDSSRIVTTSKDNTIRIWS